MRTRTGDTQLDAQLEQLDIRLKEIEALTQFFGIDTSNVRTDDDENESLEVRLQKVYAKCKQVDALAASRNTK